MGTTVTSNGELMQQIVSSMPISGTHSIHPVRTSGSGHLLFSIGDQGELFILKPDGTNGQCSLLNVGHCLGLSNSDSVSALAVSQDAANNVFVAFVVAGKSQKVANQIYVVSPKTPAEWSTVTASSSVSSWLLVGASNPMMKVEHLYLVRPCVSLACLMKFVVLISRVPRGLLPMIL